MNSISGEAVNTDDIYSPASSVTGINSTGVHCKLCTRNHHCVNDTNAIFFVGVVDTGEKLIAGIHTPVINLTMTFVANIFCDFGDKWDIEEYEKLIYDKKPEVKSCDTFLLKCN